MTRNANRPEGGPTAGMPLPRALGTALACATLLLLASPLRADEEDLSTELMRATVKIGHEQSTATGFFLCRPDPREPLRSQFVLVTAAHVFERIPGDEATLFFRARESEGVYKKAPAKLVIRAGGKPRWTKHPSEDVAVLVVAPPAGTDLPKLSPDLLATDEALRKYRVHPGDRLCCLGYPHRVEANAAGFAVLRAGPVASFPLVPAKANKTFLLNTDTFEGDSGGPVYLDDPERRLPGKEKPEQVRLILGLVTGQLFLDEEMKMIYETSKVRHRLGLAIVIQASFVREVLDSLR
jgi:hypothetical protein